MQLIPYTSDEVKAFDINIPHTYEEWARFFLATSPERVYSKRLSGNNPDVCDSWDVIAIGVYVTRKAHRGLLIGTPEELDVFMRRDDPPRLDLREAYGSLSSIPEVRKSGYGKGKGKSRGKGFGKPK